MFFKETREKFKKGQKWLIHLMNILGYQGDIRGICHGLVYMTAQAKIAGDLPTFCRRLRLLNELADSKDFADQINLAYEQQKKLVEECKLIIKAEMEEEERKNCANDLETFLSLLSEEEVKEFNQRYGRLFNEKFASLNHRDKDMLSIPAFFEDIELLFQGYKYPFLHDKKIEHIQDPKEIFHLVSPLSLDPYKGMGETDGFSGVYDLSDLLSYLYGFEELAKNVKFPVALSLSNSNHEIHLSFDYKSKEWFLLDPENMPENYINDEYYLAQLLQTYFRSEEIPLFTKIGCRKDHLEELKHYQDEWVNQISDIFNMDSKKDKVDTQNASWLYIAAQHNEIERVQALIDEGSNIDEACIDGTTPLFIAVQNNNIETIKLLLKKAETAKIDLNPQYLPQGATALYFAAQLDFYDAATLLLKAGADAKKSCFDGDAPIHIAMDLDNIKMAKLLLDYGADINQVDSAGFSPLISAILRGKEASTTFLLENNASVSESYKFKVNDLRDAYNKLNKQKSDTLEKMNSDDVISLLPRELAELLNLNNITKQITNISDQSRRSTIKG